MMALAMGFLFNTGSNKARMALLALLGAAGVAFLFTLSRSGWLSFFPMIATFVVMTKRFRVPLIAALVLLAIVVPHFAPKEAHQRVSNTFVTWKTYNVLGSKIGIDESTAARIDSWKVGVDRWVKRPILGYGIPAGAVIDNSYTRVLNETGIVGFAAFMWMLATIFSITRNVNMTMPDDEFAQSMSVGFMSGFMGLLLFSAAAAAFIIIRIMEPFWFLVAIMAVLPELEKDAEPVA